MSIIFSLFVPFPLVILKAMPHDSLEAKREMIVESRAHYRNNQSHLKEISRFKKTYCSANAITWYTHDCFVYRLINRALRTEDIFALYKFRFFIVDMCAHLEKAAIEFKKQTDSFRVYRGGKLSRDEVEKLRVGRLVACNGFLSSTRDLDVALNYICIDPSTGISHSQSRHDRQQFVLFEIDVNFTQSPDIIVADVSNQSIIPDEHEIIFNLGTTFIINHIRYDNERHLWHIHMLSSSAVADLEMGYVGIIRKRLLEISPTLLFGNLLATVSSTYRQSIEFFHRLLRSESFEEKDRPNIYFNLGRIYRYMGKYEQANQYFRHAQQLQEVGLPQSSFDYGRTLADLGTLYSEMDQPAEAISLITKAISLHNDILSQDHVEVAFNKNRLAYAYWQEKQYDKALNELSSSISSFKKMPTDHLGYAQALHTMGLVQYSLGNWKQALNDYKEALRMRESLLADDHPYVARTCYELSILYAKHINDYNSALDYARRALKIRKTKLPPNHNEVKKSIELVEYLMQQDTVTAYRPTTS